MSAVHLPLLPGSVIARHVRYTRVFCLFCADITIVCMDIVCYSYIEVRGAPLCLEGPSGIFS